ncbi:VOC family protein [Streptomyces sp. SID3212]|uniref:VOC family protein n=1 Tax=Streptomyces sp. SID3212 TaxID=2690259 RepID=UPI0019257EBE|nr:VOC family protein [Streptomyces sp. SID3212]
MTNMRILGLVFAGSSTSNRQEMTDFLHNTLSLEPTQVEGVEADLFALPDGSTFAVASPAGMGDTPRSIGFLVDNLTEAAETLRASGATVGPIAENAQERYLHFRAPDAQLYELVERKPLHLTSADSKITR